MSETNKESVVVSDAVLAALQAMADQGSDAVLAEQAADCPQLTAGGFQAVPRNAARFRARLKDQIRSPFAPPEWARLILAELDLTAPLVAVLSEAALRRGWADFAVYFGRDRLIANALLDSRLPVRQLAQEMMGKPAVGGTVDREAAGRNLRETFGPFLRQWDALRPASEPVAVPAAIPPAEPVDRVSRDELEALKRRQERELAQQRESRERWQKKEAELTQAVTKLQAQVRRHEERRCELEASLEDKERALARVRAGEADEVRDATATALNQLAQRWLKESEAVGVGLPEPGAEDVVVRAREGLARQAEHDRHYGNLRRLRDRLAELDGLQAELLTARAESLSPLAMLDEVTAAVQKERERLQGLLGLALPAGDLVKTLAAHLNAAPTLEALAQARDLVATLEGLGALAGGEAAALYRHQQNCAARFYAAHRGPTVVAAADELGRILMRHEVGAKGLWLIDGHNVLLQHPATFGMTGAEGGHERGRETLVARVCRRFQPYAGQEVRVYFDGPERQDSTAATNVRVVYSGGKGANRADRALLEYLEFRRGGEGIRVVTEDRGLAGEAARRGAARFPVSEFVALLMT